MDSKQIISIYENVSHITNLMVHAARNGEWDELTVLESRCATQIELLRQGEPHTPLPEVERSQKVRIIKKILADDREIRSFTEPWMNRLSALMNSTGTERKLVQAYGSTSAG